MTSVPQLARTIQTLLGTTADRLARSSGFLQRQRVLSGASFAQALVCGWLAAPASTLSQLAQAAATAGTPVSRQAIQQRFTPAAARFLRSLLLEALSSVVSSEPVVQPLLQRFRSVTVLDSTTITLPAVLAEHWQGCGTGSGQGSAALKVQARLDLCQGKLDGVQLQAGRTSDRTAAATMVPLPTNSLSLADLGYFAVPALAAIVAQGSHFISRLLTQTALFAPDQVPLPLTALLAQTHGEQLDRAILLGGKARFPCRLLAQRLSDQAAAQRLARQAQAARAAGTPLPQTAAALSHWLLLITSLPAEQLSLAEAFVLYRLRWQVELLFKRWKSLGLVDEWRSHKPDRILCEVYAKLLAALLLHWLTVVSGWHRSDKSLWTAARAIQGHGLTLLVSLQQGLPRIVATIRLLQRVLAVCRLTAQQTRPHAYQRLATAGPAP